MFRQIWRGLVPTLAASTSRQRRCNCGSKNHVASTPRCWTSQNLAPARSSVPAPAHDPPYILPSSAGRVVPVAFPGPSGHRSVCPASAAALWNRRTSSIRQRKCFCCHACAASMPASPDPLSSSALTARRLKARLPPNRRLPVRPRFPLPRSASSNPVIVCCTAAWRRAVAVVAAWPCRSVIASACPATRSPRRPGRLLQRSNSPFCQRPCS